MSDEPTPQIARAMIRSLTRGTTIQEGVRFLHVGHDRWLAAQRELLREVGEDGHSDTKFVRGAYGAGKSHFLAAVQHWARSQGWLCAHVECMHDSVEIDRFETLYPKITRRLSWVDGATVVGIAEDQAAPGRLLLERWAAQVLKRAGVDPNGVRKPFDSDGRVYGELSKGLMRTSLPPDFTKALMAFARASLEGDADTLLAVSDWVLGSEGKVHLPGRYLVKPVGAGKPQDHSTFTLRPIGRGSAREALRGLLWLTRNAGFSGLLLCIDEIEELARLSSKKRQDQALQALREFVDNTGSDGPYRHLCMYLAATPEMFDGPSYFPRYDALATRIQAVSTQINYRGPVVDLERTPLGADELRAIANKIVHIHGIGYEAAPSALAGFAATLVDELTTTRLRHAKPRLLARVIVDELERARQNPETYSPCDAKEALIVGARKLDEERERRDH